eukprot:TRINITY_DN62259_c0_g1_i3.p1 TRINITY_DN62259_c0_g1~~TRINITY_DN62259_c0_g1_i3.p1  ORF type:complete len:100 (-),score=27.43 TRINITY_DN62259_c0_g1_i3:533-832(-)
MSASSMIVGKVLVVGDVATGKTSFIQRYCRGYFSDEYRATIGVDFALKTLTVNGVTIRMQLWDIAGQERFANLTRVRPHPSIEIVNQASQQSINQMSIK